MDCALIWPKSLKSDYVLFVFWSSLPKKLLHAEACWIRQPPLCIYRLFFHYFICFHHSLLSHLFVSQYIIICLTHIYSLLRVSSEFSQLFLPFLQCFSSEPSSWELSQPGRDWEHVSLSPQSESVSSPREENRPTLLSFALLTAVVSNQGRRFLLMNQYELTDTLLSLNPSSTSSSLLSLRICECYLTRLICQPPSQLFPFRQLPQATWSLPPDVLPVPAVCVCVPVCACRQSGTKWN